MRAIGQWARWIGGTDFGLGGPAHPFAFAIGAWVPEPEEFVAVVGFLTREREGVLHQARHIASVCRGYNIPIAARRCPEMAVTLATWRNGAQLTLFFVLVYGAAVTFIR